MDRRIAALLSLGEGGGTVRRAVVVVDNPTRGLHATAAAGRTRGDSEWAMAVDTQFHI